MMQSRRSLSNSQFSLIRETLSHDTVLLLAA